LSCYLGNWGLKWANHEYKGSQWQTNEQKSDLKMILDGRTANWKSLDYVAGWFIKAADYGIKTTSAAAFVSTNSICQGRQVETIWSLIFATGHEITFAHTSFKWANLASHNAGVTVVIVGISNQLCRSRLLFSETNDTSTTIKVVENINAYLVPGSNTIVRQFSRPLNALNEMSFGNMPNDGGHLLLSMDISNIAVKNHNVQPKFIRPFVGSQEFIRGIGRRCVWVSDDEYPSANENTWLRDRFEGVRAKRAESDRATTQILATTPYRFGEVRQSGTERSIVVPRVSSEEREYLPVGIADSGVIVGDRNFALYDAPLWNMALIASRLHWVWIGTVCVRMRTDFSYSNTLGWNTFPVPTLTDKNKTDLTRCAEDILLAREAHFPATIADLYDPDNMPANLREAHERNDEVLERIYIGRRFKNDTERLEKLFALYTQMTAAAAKTTQKTSKSRKNARDGADNIDDLAGRFPDFPLREETPATSPADVPRLDLRIDVEDGQ
jgi:hypothetical protein